MSRKSVRKPAESLREVRFELLDPGAHKVYLAGDFNDWKPDSLLMQKGCDGNWGASVDLKPGSHEYRFVVDGVWKDDPWAQRRVANSYGSCNCVVQVT